MSLFTGRPPSLSHRYYSCPPPLDLNDETLVCGGVELEREIESLDQNGWNTKGRVFEATFVRMMLIFVLFQDEIMEMFLGNQAQWSLQRLETSFVREGASKRNLLEVAREMLGLTVFLWLERDRSANRKHDYDYIIMSYGIPSIGILCTEFVKQVKNLNEVEVEVPCSEIVRNFSMIIGFSNWVQPAAGNHKLYVRMARVIKRVLDHIFEPAPEYGTRDTRVLLEPPDNILPVDGLDDLDWPNNIDWTRSLSGDLD